MIPIDPKMAPHYLEELTRLAALLEVRIRVERLGDEETPVESGLAWIEGRPVLFLDSRLSAAGKVEAAARALAGFDLEGVYVRPAVRELLEKAGTGS